MAATTFQSSSICLLQYSRNSTAARCAMHVPEYRKIPPSTPKHVFQNTSLLQLMGSAKPEGVTVCESLLEKEKLAVAELYTILEAVVDRTEMHHNVMEQRNNWNILLLNSVNMITLTATAMAGVAASVGSPSSISSSGLRLSSFLLFSAAAGLLSVMNMIQPSQLAEEQRNATRLFRQIQSEIQTLLSTKEVNPADVEMMMNKVLALDRAYPLPLIGEMLEKFPKAMNKLEKEITSSELENRSVELELSINNGWDEKLENEMREIVKVIKLKDAEEFARLGNIALSLNKVLAVCGPVLTGMAALGTIFINSSPPIGTVATILATVGGSLACVINSLEHGGQVGMVFEMYRNCAGFFRVLEKSIESNLEESEVESREHGELFEMKVALKLGRSVSELRELADETSDGDEFASKLF